LDDAERQGIERTLEKKLAELAPAAEDAENRHDLARDSKENTITRKISSR